MLPDLTRLHNPQVADVEAPLGLHWGDVPPLIASWGASEVARAIGLIKQATFTVQPSAKAEEQALAALKHLRPLLRRSEAANIAFFAKPKHSSAWNANNMHSAFLYWQRNKWEQHVRDRPADGTRQLHRLLDSPERLLHVFTVGFVKKSGHTVQAVGLGLYKTTSAGKLKAVMLNVIAGLDEQAAYKKWAEEYEAEVGELKV